ncbi:hypothetical protein PVK06_018593 [Gossypium arboreum]|uniref:Phospholipid/glycerol acyltransferase domain-containing protein n=1 Tax=Gossypium arboreum TaxID=29729 RepID=A0ABR0PI11_GOSAR|nr:hypothetical protein PVK06_018593 [Gossypium arboreum]
MQSHFFLAAGLVTLAPVESFFSTLLMTPTASLTHVPDSISSKGWVLRESLHNHRLGGNHLYHPCITILQELALLLEFLSRSPVDHGQQFRKFHSNVGGMAVKDWGISVSNLPWVVHDDDLRGEAGSLLCRIILTVQRESKSSDFKGVAGVVTDRVREAHHNGSAPVMLLFPEGTTTNGDYLLSFKTGAFLAGAPVVRHVVFLLCQIVNHMEVMHLPTYYPLQQEKDDPKLYANNVRRLMATEGNLIMSDIGLAEKRMYHAALNGNNRLPSVLHQKDD